MSYIRVKLDSPSLPKGPGRVVEVGLEEPQPDTCRVEWLRRQYEQDRRESR